MFEEGETYSPGPARYSMAEAQERMNHAPWIKKTNKSNFNQAKRSVGSIESQGQNEIGPGYYTASTKDIMVS